ncbi:BPSL0761 family protein [Pseudomonas viridiflava]|uniref:BPSL0761 family protein n=1 Tax=Pseudomonas viridiflava TaxID=33069 RepID=UPI002A6B507D|nr:BPSL0761 family protein [Pseudomonas viridiflava]MDY0938289.1 BPSL0761 family protein [Pseudomonas viridiflava]MDY1014998.1 BPSL0761 family protein [Pseudomonas viridiflava]
MPHERSRAVIQTEDFLHELSRDTFVPERVRKDAKFLLRHFPSRRDVFSIRASGCYEH